MEVYPRIRLACLLMSNILPSLLILMSKENSADPLLINGSSITERDSSSLAISRMQQVGSSDSGGLASLAVLLESPKGGIGD